MNKRRHSNERHSLKPHSLKPHSLKRARFRSASLPVSRRFRRRPDRGRKATGELELRPILAEESGRTMRLALVPAHSEPRSVQLHLSGRYIKRPYTNNRRFDRWSISLLHVPSAYLMSMALPNLSDWRREARVQVPPGQVNRYETAKSPKQGQPRAARPTEHPGRKFTYSQPPGQTKRNKAAEAPGQARRAAFKPSGEHKPEEPSGHTPKASIQNLRGRRRPVRSTNLQG